MPGTTQFSAPDPTLGYLYQVRLALLWALKRMKNNNDFLISIETLDDVTFETTGGIPSDLLQLKHHKRNSGNLTDYSSDLWKTLRVWIEGHSNSLFSTNTNLYLITTGKAPEGSAAALLGPIKRNIEVAKAQLDSVAATSNNVDLKKAFEVYKEKNKDDILNILDRVIILDCTPNVFDINLELSQEVFWATEREYITPFLERLEGWWFQKVLQHLSELPSNRIGSLEIDSKMTDLRDQFRRDSLPIDDDLIFFELDEAIEKKHLNSKFVIQLELIKADKRRIAFAIQDYYKAYVQRSRWIREDLLVEMDLSRYERKLIEEWERFFLSIKDDLGSEDSERAKEKAAKSVLKWAESTIFPIRPRVTEEFISRGTFHILADSLRIGWHPDFKERLSKILKGDES